MKIEIEIPDLPEGCELTENTDEANFALVVWNKGKYEWQEYEKLPKFIFCHAYAKKKKKPVFVYEEFYNTCDHLGLYMFGILLLDCYKQFLKESNYLKEGIEL